MTDLIRFCDGIPQWPYSAEMLRADEPQLSLSRELPEHELATLAQIGVHVKRVRPADPPSVDDSTHRVQMIRPVEIDGEPVQQWGIIELTPEERAEWLKAHTSPPDYVGFYQALLISATYQQGVLPRVINNDLPTLTIFESQFGEARNGRPIPDALQAALWIFLAELQPTQEMAVEIQALLQQFHLANLYALQPSS
jgi:hypothetical protein